MTIVGDIAHSRVARSNIFGLVAMGADVTVCGPPTLIPTDIERLGVTVESNLRRAVVGADAINVLRIQLERQKAGMFPSVGRIRRRLGCEHRGPEAGLPDCIVMHPGPMNRGIEIAQDVADGDRAVILEQVTNGVAVRMAVLYLLSGGEHHDSDEEGVAEADETRAVNEKKEMV